MEILIKAFPHNHPAKIIASALKSRGHHVDIDMQSSFPAKQFSSLSLSQSQESSFATSGKDIEINARKNYDAVIWLNREKIEICSSAAKEDKDYIALESDLFLRSSNYFLGDDAFWVNPLASYARSSLKPVQLSCAKNVGFTIPNTLISNNNTDVLHFIKQSKKPVIAKPFSTINWQENDELFYFPTTIITAEQVEASAEEVQLCPIIYQECIEKRYELRVTVMGSTVIAAKINNQPDGKVDWREVSASQELDIEKVTLPAAVHDKCLALMESLGLVYGCLDLIVDKEGRYYFLEVNNAGQFLWKELYGDGMPLLHIYCDFIESQDKHFLWDGQAHYLYKEMLTKQGSPVTANTPI